MKTKSKIILFMSTLFITMIFTAVSAFAAIDEREPNDGKENAHVIKVGTTVYGSVIDTWDYDDDDWFKITAPISGTIKMTLWVDSGEGNSYSYPGASIKAFDGNLEELAEVYDDSGTDRGYSGMFGVISGRAYYIKISTSSDLANYHFSVKYSIGTTTIKSIKGKTKAFTVKWEKKRSSAFYQVQYTRKSTYDDYHWRKAKIVKVSSKSNSKTIKKLAQKKKYYVRVRVARTIDGVTYYSGWSGKKVVKTK